MDVTHAIWIAVAALAAGAINAIAGGGSLLSFPALVASGLPAITASMTNTVALCPGYFGATFAQRRELAGQGTRIARLLPLSAVGSVAGAFILLHTTEKGFETVIPFLLLFAAGLLAAQGALRRRLAGHAHAAHSMTFAMIAVGASAIYGAYFGAGLGVILLAILGVVIDDTLIRANALKQLLSLAINTIAAVLFIVTGTIDWAAALIVAIGSLVGGVIGGKLVSHVRESVLRAFAVAVALAVAAVYFAKL